MPIAFTVGAMPFSVMKVCYDMRRFLLRALKGVHAFRFKKLLNLIAALRAEQRTSAKNEI